MQQQGEHESFSPSSYLRARYPDVRAEETDLLPGGILGCVDHEKRIIWLARGLTSVQRRCTLAYEIAELVQGPTPTDPCMAAAHRRAAEDWAAQMLIGRDGVAAAFAECYTIPEAAAWLGVDTPTLRARLRGLSDAEQDAVMSAIHHLHKTA